MHLLTQIQTLQVAGGCLCSFLKDHFGEGLVIESSEPVSFSDSSLGLPEPGYVYMQVITKGAILKGTLNGEPITIHIADDGRFKVKS